MGTKQSGQADKAVWLACFVLCPLPALALQSEFCTDLYTLSNLLFLDVYGSCQRWWSVLFSLFCAITNKYLKRKKREKKFHHCPNHFFFQKSTFCKSGLGLYKKVWSLTIEIKCWTYHTGNIICLINLIILEKSRVLGPTNGTAHIHVIQKYRGQLWKG